MYEAELKRGDQQWEEKLNRREEVYEAKVKKKRSAMGKGNEQKGGADEKDPGASRREWRKEIKIY